MAFSAKQKKLGLFFFLFVLLVISAIFFWLKIGSRLRQKALINNTSYEKSVFKGQWPLQIVDNLPDSYMIRMVIEPKVFVGDVYYQNLVMRAWNYGIYKDKDGMIQRIAIPRAWYDPDQSKLFFLTTIAPIKVEFLTNKFLIAMIERGDERHANKQQLVGVFFSPIDPAIDPSVVSFYKEVAQRPLPLSFVNSGKIDDLPSAPEVGHFLPATQLMFDVLK